MDKKNSNLYLLILNEEGKEYPYLCKSEEEAGTLWKDMEGIFKKQMTASVYRLSEKNKVAL